jgi:hypothetical protein
MMVARCSRSAAARPQKQFSLGGTMNEEMQEILAADVLMLRLCVEQLIADRMLEPHSPSQALEAFIDKVRTVAAGQAPVYPEPAPERIYPMIRKRLDDLALGVFGRIVTQRHGEPS